MPLSTVFCTVFWSPLEESTLSELLNEVEPLALSEDIACGIWDADGSLMCKFYH